MVVVDELEVREGELLLYKGSELFLDGLCPLANEDDELVDVPSDTTTNTPLDVRWLM